MHKSPRTPEEGQWCFIIKKKITKISDGVVRDLPKYVIHFVINFFNHWYIYKGPAHCKNSNVHEWSRGYVHNYYFKYILISRQLWSALFLF